MTVIMPNERTEKQFTDQIALDDHDLVEAYLLIGPWEILMKSYVSNFQTNFSGWWLGYFLWNYRQMNVPGPEWW